ncbi:MAG TPA: ATP-binding protein [Bradyrhizobium sp.]|nr:ATP-binding protein [Bradyrhizobium sp.]
MSLSHSGANHPSEQAAKTAAVLWTPYRYFIPIVAVGTATGITYLLDLIAPEGQNQFLFFVAVIVSAWFAEAGPGWLSVVLSIVSVDYFFLPPIYVLDLSVKDLPWLIAFVGCAAATNWLGLKRRRMEERLVQAHNELEQRVNEQTQELREANQRLIAEMADRARTEAALRETQNELARAARIMTVGELTSSIAHEINQPLAAVMSNAEAALNWLQRDPPALVMVKESVAGIIAAGGRASDIIVRIRSLIKRGPPDLVKLSINEVVDDVLATARVGFKTHNVMIEQHLEPALPAMSGDRIQLRQLVSNLLNNAAEAMADVFDRPRRLVVCTKRTPGNGIAITVEDVGIGFAGADSTRLFQPFYSTKAEGTGLGLSICRSIAEFHGGKISAVSNHPYGVVVCVELPAARS